jgi:NAD(P)-dependent dehydrogenase (short-subunit alcohol dehydrogenase family)
MQGRQILVTGGAGGLGLAVCRHLCTLGAHLVVPLIAAGDEPRVRESLPHSARVQFTVVDLLAEDQVGAIIAAMPKLDGVVHLVGGFAMGPTPTFTRQAFEHQLQLNVVSTFLVLKHALARMLAAGYGRIVTVGSRAAEQPQARLAAYSAAKAAVVALTRSIAAETRGTGVTANCVLPSTIDTPANREAMGDAAARDWVKPERLAETIAFLLSDAAGDLRGSALRVYANA